MRKIRPFLIIILACLLAYAMLAVYPKGHTLEPTVKSQSLSSLPFKNGECLAYGVRYKDIKIGRSILIFHGEENLGDKKVYYITFSTDIPSFKDTEELYAEKDSFLPVEVHRSIKKRIGFNDRIEEKYDQENFRVEVTSKSKLRTKSFSIEKDSRIHNAILLTYYCRSIENFEKEGTFKIALPTVDFEVSFKGTESIKTPLGQYEAYVFTSDPPRFKLWLSTDERRVPLKIENPSTLGYSLVIESIK